MGTGTPLAPRVPERPAGVVELPSVEALLDPAALEAVFGPVAHVAAERVETDGTTASIHQRVRARLASGETLSLWLKQVRLSEDWTAQRSGDTVGREAALLAEPRLADVWESFHCHYRAFAFGTDGYGLLMDDVSDRRVVRALWPRGEIVWPIDRMPFRRSLDEEEEDAILRAMAGLHARYWESDAASLPWLQSRWHRLFVLGPRDRTQSAAERAVDRVGLCDRAIRRMPAAVGRLLSAPTDEQVERCAGLPSTVFHGDLKPTNLALQDRKLIAYDWGLMGSGPCTFDLGWQVFMHWRVRARRPERVVARYRELLEARLGAPLPEPLWQRLVAAGLLCGAIMHTWVLMRSLEEGIPGAAEEWDWRVAQLERLA